MNELEVKNVPFLGADLMAARDGSGQIWAGVRWMCKGIGLSRGRTNGELAKVQRDEVLRKGCTKFTAGVFDPNNETVALKLDYVPLWLAKINITPKMKAETPELAGHLEQYQLKAKDILAAAFVMKNPEEELTPLVKVLTRLEQKQRAQDYALEGLAKRFDSLYPAQAAYTRGYAELDAGLGELEARLEKLEAAAKREPMPKRPAPDPQYQVRIQGELYRLSKKSRAKLEFLEQEAQRQAVERVRQGVYSQYGYTDALAQAYGDVVHEMAGWYGV